MRQPGLDERLGFFTSVEPSKERSHFRFDTFSNRSLKVNLLGSCRAGNNLYSTLTPGPCAGFLNAAAAAWKQCGVPAE